MTSLYKLSHVFSYLTPYLAFWMTVSGSITGSFLACLVSRRQSHESILTGRSHCQACRHPLYVPDLIPIISYLTHRGRCRYCGSKIPASCFMAELSGALLYLAIFLRFGMTWNTLMWLLAGTLLLAMSLIDAAERIIPNRILLLLAAVRFLFLPLSLSPNSLGRELLSILTGTLIIPGAMLFLTLLMDKAMKKETMGGGDIKLIFVLGLYLDWKNMFFMIFTSCSLGLLWIAVRKIFRRQNEISDSTIAFGPFLSIGCLAALCLGEPFIRWYVNLF